MNFEWVSISSIALVIVASLVLLISQDWRLSISALGVVYLGSFILIRSTWPIEMAVVKLVAGWISASVLGMALVNLGSQEPFQSYRRFPSEIIFRISAACIISMVAISLTPAVQEWLFQSSYEQTLGGLLLIGMGLFHLGFSVHPFGTIIGLLTFFAGFEILYAIVESSVLVAGFLSVINMGVSLVGAYMLIAPNLEVES